MHYKHYLSASPSEPSPAQVLGSMVDCFILTPDNFDKKFVMKPELNLRTNEGKKLMEEFQLANAGKYVVDQEQFDKASAIKDAVFSNEQAVELLSKITQTQSRNTWTDEITQLPCVGLLDGEGDDVILELKTSHNAHHDNFVKDAHNYLYHMQTAMYYDSLVAKGKKNIKIKFLVVETTEPYGVCVYTASKDFLALGRKVFYETLNDFKTCLNDNLFDIGYKPTTLDIPYWAKRQLQYS